jgi:UDPglucose--hexose-1-phosphate uridylyltransferase
MATIKENIEMNADVGEGIREIRINPIVPTESVLVSTARGLRPRKEEKPLETSAEARVEKCPFCKGNEEQTPPTLASWPSDEQENAEWKIRIVENLFPVLSDRQISKNLSFGLQHVIDGYGRHEVVIDHDNHSIHVDAMSQEHICALFKMYRDRMQVLYKSDPRIKYVLVFKNFGPAAGASIAHTHSQIVAMPVVPENVANELHHSYKHFHKYNQNIFSHLVDEALTFEATIYDRESGKVRRKIDVGQYVIEKTEKFIAIKPFASRFEWEVQIYPLFAQADYLGCNDDDLEDFAYLLKRTMMRLNKVIGGAQYNYFLHSIPHGEEFKKHHESYQWHLEICPRTSIPTGFELGSGLFVSTVSPEDAAKQLREVEID